MDSRMFDEVLGYQNDKAPRKALGWLGEVGNSVGNIAGAPMSKAWDLYTNPNMNPSGALMRQGLEAGAGWLGQTDTAQQALGWLDDHPNTASALSDALAATQLIPGGYMFRKGLTTPVKSTMNTAAQNLRTRLDGFYTGDPLGAMARGFSPSNTFQDMMSPQARANFRATTGTNRRKEFVENINNRQTAHAVGNARASADMRMQANRKTQTGNLLDDMPMATGSSLGLVRSKNRDQIKQLSQAALPEGHNTPDYILDFMVNKPLDDLGKREGREYILARGAQLGRPIPSADRAMVSVVDHKAPNTELPWEVTGGGSFGGSAAKATSSKPVLTSAESVLGPKTNWTPEQWADFYKVSGAFERDKWLGKASLNEKLPDNKFTRKVTEMVAGSDRSPGLRDVFGGKNKKPVESMARYWKARSAVEKYQRTGKGAKPTPEQLKIVAAVDKLKENTNINLMKNPDGSVKGLSYQGSFLSQDQDLGGVGYRIVHDFENDNIYTNGFDGHDLMGADPAGGDQFYNLTPIMVKKPGEKVKISRRSKQDTEARATEQLKRLEERTGMPRGANESAQAYQTRVMQDYNAPISLSDYMQPVRALSLGVDLSPNTEDKEP